MTAVRSVVGSPFVGYRTWMVDGWKKKYHRVNSVCCSPDGSLVAAGDSSGRIAVFSLKKYLSGEYWLGAQSRTLPKAHSCDFQFLAHFEGPTSLLSSSEYLVSYVASLVWCFSLTLFKCNEC